MPRGYSPRLVTDRDRTLMLSKGYRKLRLLKRSKIQHSLLEGSNPEGLTLRCEEYYTEQLIKTCSYPAKVVEIPTDMSDSAKINK